MNYRQWKKNYKNAHGINPPISIDKRKQKKQLKTYLDVLDMQRIIAAIREITRIFSEAWNVAETAVAKLAVAMTRAERGEE
jgi:hypothetical protein